MQADVAAAQNAIHDLQPGTPIWFTECTGGYYAPDFASNLPYMVESDVINVLRNWGKSVTLWNMDLDATGGPTVQNGCTDCRGVVTIDTSTTPATVERNVEYYVLGHLSKYVQTGAYRIDSNSFGSGNVEDVAFKNPDGSIAVVVLNAASNPEHVQHHVARAEYRLHTAGRRGGDICLAGVSGIDIWRDRGAGQPDRGSGKRDGICSGCRSLRHGSRAGESRSRQPAGWRDGTIRPTWLSPNQSLLTLEASGNASAGTYPMTVTGTQGNVQRSSTVNLTVGGQDTPFGGTAWALPGLIQAENFDNGGDGVGYFTLLTNNPAGTNYRPGANVGIEGTSDAGGGYDVGYTAEGQWLQYAVNVSQSGLYNLQARVASLGAGGYWHVEFDGRNATGNLFTPGHRLVAKLDDLKALHFR